MRTSAQRPCRSIARYISILAVTLLGITMLSVCAVISVITLNSSRASIFEQVNASTQQAIEALNAVNLTTSDLAQRMSESFAHHIDPALQLNSETSELISFGRVLNGDNEIVDRFSRDTGAVVTVFARKADDFIRISTSIKNEQGHRALGTTLDHAHPAYSHMLEGGIYLGRAILFGTPYMTRYQSVKDRTGQVIAVLFVGFDLTSFEQRTREQLEAKHFFDHGRLMLLDPKPSIQEAVFVVHPTAQGQKVLNAYPQAQDYLEALADNKQHDIIKTRHSLLPQQGDNPWVIRRVTQDGRWLIAEVSDDEAMATPYRTLQLMWLVMAVALVVVGGVMYTMLTRSLSLPLLELSKAINTVASGDLTQPLHTQRRDEVGTLIQDVDRMRVSYQDILHQVSQTADSVASASAQIMQGNQNLANRAESAANNLSQIAQKVLQFAGVLRQSADMAQQAKSRTDHAETEAGRGGIAMTEVVDVMAQINHRSLQIAEIISTIDGIAFQTNILALNAAVEAARAGEQGRGFAVVAGEVRNLANRSAEAAKEIRTLIGASVEKADAGSHTVQQAGRTVNDIVESVHRIGVLMGHIHDTSTEQATGILEINHAVEELESVAQHNAAMVEQATVAAMNLNQQAQELTSALQVFQLDLNLDKKIPVEDMRVTRSPTLSVQNLVPSS